MKREKSASLKKMYLETKHLGSFWPMVTFSIFFFYSVVSFFFLASRTFHTLILIIKLLCFYINKLVDNAYLKE